MACFAADPVVGSEGDRVVLWVSGAALGCGLLASALALYACLEPVLTLFVPELGWIILVPSLLIALLGAVGLCASRSDPSKLFRAQLSVFMMILAVLLAAAGVFSFCFVGAAAHWIFEGCVGYRTEGIWSNAGRVEHKLKIAHEEYKQLACGWERCRLLNPLIYDLAACGHRAQCPGGNVSSSLPLYGWFQHLQVTVGCGGFCKSEVPIFGLTTMKETIEVKPACVGSAVELLRITGRCYGVAAAAASLPTAIGAILLACSARWSSDDFEEVVSSDDEAALLSDRKLGY